MPSCTGLCGARPTTLSPAPLRPRSQKVKDLKRREAAKNEQLRQFEMRRQAELAERKEMADYELERTSRIHQEQLSNGEPAPTKSRLTKQTPARRCRPLLEGVPQLVVVAQPTPRSALPRGCSPTHNARLPRHITVM